MSTIQERLRSRFDVLNTSSVFRHTGGDNVGEVVYVADVIAFAASEVKRALHFCHDCGCEVVSGPVLCEGCLSIRNSEGMDTEDSRTIDEWRKT